MEGGDGGGAGGVEGGLEGGVDGGLDGGSTGGDGEGSSGMADGTNVTLGVTETAPNDRAAPTHTSIGPEEESSGVVRGTAASEARRKFVVVAAQLDLLKNRAPPDALKRTPSRPRSCGGMKGLDSEIVRFSFAK